ncbi:hypothetical protein EIP91_004569 [Steccherinum ochraceum]|uniref:Uncharacterized protein n=1 Tax=Steccherinum ochraceum TaxID=92696 RepID=A0A4R0R8J6_9APHY|nr:hypothetical protein EIP91_004569 [Steccherinum ochraceum]
MAQTLEASVIEDAKKLTVKDKEGKEYTFGSLLEKQDSIVVFIPNVCVTYFMTDMPRRLGSQSCQQYTRQLAGISPDALAKANKQLLVIGCGEPDVMDFYIEATGYKGPLYADSSRAIFDKFGLISNLKVTPDGEPKRSNLQASRLNVFFTSFWRGPVKNAKYLGKEGKVSQLGGEFIFTKDGQCTFLWRMKHTEDHIEVADLMREAGVEYP